MSAPLARVHDVLAEFAGHLEQPSAPAIDSRWAGQSLASGAAGTALFHSEYSARGLARWGNAHQWLQQATADDLSAEESTGLYLGATAVAFALQNVPQDRTPLYQGARDTLHRHVLALTHRRVDAASARIARQPAKPHSPSTTPSSASPGSAPTSCAPTRRAAPWSAFSTTSSR